MPGFVTHYIFGCENITKIENKHIKESVKKHKAVYALGLQGPDLFFFSPFSFTGKRKRLGSIMHIYNTGEFLENLSIEVETVVACEDDDSTMNVGTVYTKTMQLKTDEDLCVTSADYEVLETGELKIAKKLLADYNKNDRIKVLFADKENKPILT